MKASKFTDAQKAFVFKQSEEGTPVAEICRKAGISQATSLNWQKRYPRIIGRAVTICRNFAEPLVAVAIQWSGVVEDPESVDQIGHCRYEHYRGGKSDLVVDACRIHRQFHNCNVGQQPKNRA